MSAAGFMCGPAKGTEKSMRCPCCGFESDNLESFAVSMCWPCGFGMNIECDNCVRNGVWVDRFSTRHSRGHRLRHIITDHQDAVTACGLTIPYSDIGQGTAVRQPCRHCWRDDEDPR